MLVLTVMKWLAGFLPNQQSATLCLTWPRWLSRKGVPGRPRGPGTENHVVGHLLRQFGAGVEVELRLHRWSREPGKDTPPFIEEPARRPDVSEVERER
jgi:hypothetical protein